MGKIYFTKVAWKEFLYGFFLALRYIVRNNPWYWVAPRIIRASFMQILQRMTGIIIPIRLFNGKYLFLFPKNTVSSMFLYTDVPDKREILFLRSLCTKNTIFIDIGAHIGSYSVCLMDKVKDIVVFEPDQGIALWCRMNFLLNDWPSPSVHQLAVCRKNGTVRFTNDNNKTQNHITSVQKNSTEVRSVTLDTFAKTEKLSKKYSYVLKIDVEGAEVEVVKGALKFLALYRISGIVYESFGKRAEQMKEILEKKGFIVRPLSEHNYSAVRNSQGVARNMECSQTWESTLQ